MYVCVCNAVTERDIDEAIDAGAEALADLRNRLQVATCCGMCEETAAAYLAAGLARTARSDQRAGRRCRRGARAATEAA